MTDRIAEQGAVLYGLDNPTSAGVSRLGAAGALQAAIADAIDNGFSSATASRLGGRGRLYALAAASAFSPLSLFSSSEVGVWYDPSDFSTMFQDSAGTTPVTAVEQPVGLLLDKSKGLVLGSNLVTNGTFDADASWTKSGGWAISGGSASHPTGEAGSLTQSIALVAGKTYEVSFDVSAITGASSISLTGGTAVAYTFTTVGQHNVKLTALSGNTAISAYCGAVSSVTFDNISVRELPGNHATQATSTARPVLRAGLDYDGVDDHHDQSAGGGSTTAFFLCAGIKPEGGAGAVRVMWSDAGTNTGYIVRINASNQLELAAGNATAYTTIATVATLDVGTAYVVTVWDDGTNLNVQVNNNAVASVARPVVAAGTATASIGSDNGAATGWFNGLIYSLIQVKDDAGTDAERASAKAYVASKAGVAL